MEHILGRTPGRVNIARKSVQLLAEPEKELAPNNWV